jgi:hypothetical protein
MPKVRPLTATQQRTELNKTANQTLAEISAIYKLRTKKTDGDIGKTLGVHKQKVFRMRNNPGKENLDDIRVLMHSIGATKEDWLRLGGFKI